MRVGLDDSVPDLEAIDSFLGGLGVDGGRAVKGTSCLDGLNDP